MDLEQAKEIVFEKKKNFASLYRHFGTTHWQDYIEHTYPTSFNPSTHFIELTSTLEKLLTPLLGKEKTARATHTLLKTGFVSTCDHSGVLCHPFFSNSAYARSLTLTATDSLITFTCGGVSLTNSSFPRSIFFHDKNLTLQKLHLQSLAGRRRSVYGLAPFSQKQITRIIEQTKHLALDESAKQKLTAFLTQLHLNQHLRETKYFSDQLVIINDLLWQTIFGDKRGSLVYVEAEQVVRQLFLDIHLHTKTPIHSLLFDKHIRETYLSHFEGIVGAHDRTTQTGSDLFWYIDELHQTRVQLFIEEEYLVSKDHTISIPLTPEAIETHLRKYTLLPTMALSYSILSFYYGLTLGGGFSQIDYLGDMKEAWDNTFNTKTPIKTDVFAGEFALLGISDHIHTVPATLFDVLLYAQDPHITVNEALSNVSIKESLDAMMDELVEIVSGTKPELANKLIPTFYVN